MTYTRGKNPVPSDPIEIYKFLIRWSRVKRSGRQDHEDFACWAFLKTKGFSTSKTGRYIPQWLHRQYIQGFEDRPNSKLKKDTGRNRIQLNGTNNLLRYEMPDPLNTANFYGKLSGKELLIMRLYLEADFTAMELNIPNWKLKTYVDYLKERHAKSA